MTGTISEVAPKQAYCKITGDDGKLYFAHRKMFADRSLMQIGVKVSFQRKPLHPVMKVEALATPHSTDSIS